MRLCMIGTRGHYGYVLESLDALPHVAVAGLSAGTMKDDVSKLVQWCEEHGHEPRVFDDYREMLDSVEPELLVVDGPFERHAEMCIEAFDRGINVFSEKPVATNTDDLCRLRKAYAGAGVHFAGMMGLRYEPAFYTAWQSVRNGAVGEVRLISTRKSYKLGDRPAFYRDRDTYGGTIPWVGSHAFDWIMWFSGEKAETVYATHSTQGNRGHGDLEVSGMCLFSMTNGVAASASIDFLRPGGAQTHGDDRLRVAGTEGVIEVRGGKVLLINGEQDGERVLTASCDRRIFKDFVAQVEGKDVGLISAEDTIELTRVCLLALRSADERLVVDCRETD